MNTKSLQQQVVNKIVEALEKGVKPWVKPWDSTSSENLSLPINYETGKHYSGINIVILWAEMVNRGYKSNVWLTFKQAHKLGGYVKKGELGTHCFYYAAKEIEDENGKPKTIFYNKKFVVFNVEQIEDICCSLPEQPKSDFEFNKKAEQIMQATGATISKYCKEACYSSPNDIILLPPEEAFINPESFYSTLLHELVHWTGHVTRLNRHTKSVKYGDEAYAFEELVAELGSAFLCAELGLNMQGLQHASYIDSWLKILRADYKALFSAASLASKAHNYINTLNAESEMAKDSTEENLTPVTKQVACSDDKNVAMGFALVKDEGTGESYLRNPG